MIMDWDQVVKKISVSSNVNQMAALYDESTSSYWQSSGQQNKVVNAYMFNFQIRIIFDNHKNSSIRFNFQRRIIFDNHKIVAV